MRRQESEGLKSLAHIHRPYGTGVLRPAGTPHHSERFQSLAGGAARICLDQPPSPLDLVRRPLAVRLEPPQGRLGVLQRIRPPAGGEEGEGDVEAGLGSRWRSPCASQ